MTHSRRTFLALATATALGVFAFSAAAEERGTLSVTSDPPARVSIDGQDTGKVTPLQAFPLAAGAHKLTLVSLDGKQKRSLGFTVRAGQQTKLHVSLGDE